MSLRVGLVGTGPWARMAHAPILTGGPETTLVGVWGRRPEAAAELASDFGTEAVADYADLLERCDAVAFAVPPEVQAQMALEAAHAGKHLLLDKPVAATAEAAADLAAAVDEVGVSSLVLLTMHFTRAFNAFLDRCSSQDLVAVSFEGLNGAFLEGPFSQSPWRHHGGVLPDVGPHVVSACTALLGPVVDARAASHAGVVRLELTHESGALSQALLSAHHRGPAVRSLRAVTEDAVLECEWTPPDDDLWGTVRRAFTETVSTGAAHLCDVHRGAELQRVLSLALRNGAR